MLMLCEPIAAAVTFHDINVEIKTCIKCHLLPGQRNGLVNVYRVLHVHEASRIVLRLHTICPHTLTTHAHIDAPAFLEHEWHIQRGRPKDDHHTIPHEHQSKQ